MLTPFDLKDALQAIEDSKRIEERTLGPGLAEASYRRNMFNLYEKVIKEIANGSIDPKTLARTVLKKV